MTPAEHLLAPLDAMRRGVLRVAPLKGLLSAREPRVAALATLAVAASFALSLWAPLALLALTPVVLGVPHLLADLRYLVVRPGLHRRRALWPAAAPLLLVSLTGEVSLGFLAVAWVLAISRRPLWAALALGAAAGGVALGFEAALALAYAHNFVAVLLWWRWRPRSTRLHRVPLALFAVCTAAIGCGAFALADTGDFDWLGPPRLVLLFAFTQAVHYAVWLRLIPEDDRPRPAVRGFRGSFEALRADFGTWPLLIAAGLAVGIAGWALADLDAARAGYFRLALFHGHLELAALALSLGERRS